jgi:hypothetical protein
VIYLFPLDYSSLQVDQFSSLDSFLADSFGYIANNRSVDESGNAEGITTFKEGNGGLMKKC